MTDDATWDDASKVSAREPELLVDYKPGPGTPSSARRAVREAVAAHRVAASQAQTLALLVSELVTNAVIHPDVPAASRIGLSIAISAQMTRVVVSDAGAGFEWPAQTLPAGRPGGGFGLLLLNQEASRWGTLAAPGRFSVWFELDHAPAV